MLMVNAVLLLLFLGHPCDGLPLWSFDKYDASHRCYGRVFAKIGNMTHVLVLLKIVYLE